MPSKILEYIAKFVKLDEEEALLFCNSFKEVKVKKRQFIVQPNFTAKHRNYVLKGAFRAYVIGDEGQDHTINIAIDDWWITDYNSYIYQQPATLFVVALEDSTVLQIDYDKEQSLKKQITNLKPSSESLQNVDWHSNKEDYYQT
ncbi:MAG TPA: cyclic nucleotide-binding domain-containing protein [Saprospiraceae bacterium]|nr:cyclic nucleotide-binding domain-containing protein [Saprospiraceae bacterium]